MRLKKYGILVNRKPLMCIALAPTCLFHLLNMQFSDVCAENIEIISVTEMIFSPISNMTCRTHRGTKI